MNWNSFSPRLQVAVSPFCNGLVCVLCNSESNELDLVPVPHPTCCLWRIQEACAHLAECKRPPIVCEASNSWCHFCSWLWEAGGWGLWDALFPLQWNKDVYCPAEGGLAQTLNSLVGFPAKWAFSMIPPPRFLRNHYTWNVLLETAKYNFGDRFYLLFPSCKIINMWKSWKLQESNYFSSWHAKINRFDVVFWQSFCDGFVYLTTFERNFLK